MSNVMTQSPLVIDTVGATSAKTGAICIERIRWVGATTAAHAVTITDTAGSTIWASHAPTTNYTEESEINQWFNGLIVTVLGSGKLYIYYH